MTQFTRYQALVDFDVEGAATESEARQSVFQSLSKQHTAEKTRRGRPSSSNPATAMITGIQIFNVPDFSEDPEIATDAVYALKVAAGSADVVE